MTGYGGLDNFIINHPSNLPGDDYEVFDKGDYIESNEVNHPEHYTQGEIECIDAITAATVNKKGIEAVCVANVIKYLWRYEKKGGKKDVEKAKWYIEKLLDNL